MYYDPMIALCLILSIYISYFLMGQLASLYQNLYWPQNILTVGLPEI